MEQKICGLLENVLCLKSNGIQLAYIKKETVCLKMPLAEHMVNHDGKMFGGSMYGLADVTAGMTDALDGRIYATQNSSFSFVNNISNGTAWAVGSVLCRKRKAVAVDVKVYGDDGQLLAFGIFNVLSNL